MRVHIMGILTRPQLESDTFMTAGLRLVAYFVFLIGLLSIPLPGNCSPGLPAAGVADGPGVWVNLWNYPQGDVDAYFSKLRSHGIRNLYIQTSRSNTEALPNAGQLGPVIDASHRHHIRVIAWSFTQLFNPDADADKLVAAARFQSPHGERIDAIAGNMETNLAQAKVEAFSRRLRAELGRSYPMVAVVYSPLNKALPVAQIPWKTLGEYWDVIAPMTYWAGKHQPLDAYTYTVATIRKVRELCGRSDVEVQPIGDGMRSTSAQVQEFMRACHDCEAAGASLYPDQRLTENQLACMSGYPNYFQPNSRFRLAAFHEMRKSGALPEPPGLDPSQSITRGQLYKLVATQLLPGTPGNISAADAYQSLSDLGLTPVVTENLISEKLASPVSSREAYTLVASLVEMRTRQPALNHQMSLKKRRRMDSWLVQPARAEADQAESSVAHPLNYLDAAQLVLQARAGV